MASSSALQFLQHSGRHGRPVSGHQSGAGGSIIHNVACSAAQQCRIAIRLYEAYRMHVKWQIASTSIAQFGAMLFSKQGRLPCCRLEMCIRSGSYNSINSNHSASWQHVREWLSTPIPSRFNIIFQVASTQNHKHKYYAFTKWKGVECFPSM